MKAPFPVQQESPVSAEEFTISITKTKTKINIWLRIHLWLRLGIVQPNKFVGLCLWRVQTFVAGQCIAWTIAKLCDSTCKALRWRMQSFAWAVAMSKRRSQATMMGCYDEKLHIFAPTNVAASPAAMLRNIYARHSMCWLLRSIVRASLLNVEKVVKPPHIPTTSNRRRSGDRLWRAIHVPSSPMRKHPMMFTANVPNGKTAEPSHLLIRYLSMLPVPPPMNINIICFMFLLFLFMSFFTTVHFYGTVV